MPIKFNSHFHVLLCYCMEPLNRKKKILSLKIYLYPTVNLNRNPTVQMYVFICIYTILYGIAVYMCFSLLYVMVGRIFLASILNTHAFLVNSLEYGQTQKMSSSGWWFSCSCGVDYLDVGRCQYGVPPVVMYPDRQRSLV